VLAVFRAPIYLERRSKPIQEHKPGFRKKGDKHETS
jgi:hypothetical protein